MQLALYLPTHVTVRHIQVVSVLLQLVFLSRSIYHFAEISADLQTTKFGIVRSCCDRVCSPCAHAVAAQDNHILDKTSFPSLILWELMPIYSIMTIFHVKFSCSTDAVCVMPGPD
jgi:hypothetical protein